MLPAEFHANETKLPKHRSGYVIKAKQKMIMLFRYVLKIILLKDIINSIIMSLKSLRQTIIQQVRCFTFLRPYFR
jgi:hypothetical protein